MSDFLVFQLVAGNTFLPGLAFVVVGVLCRIFVQQKLVDRLNRYVLLVGAFLVLLSSTPSWLWLYGIWFTLVWGFSLLPNRFQRTQKLSGAALILLSAAMATNEVRFLTLPTIPVRSGQTIYVIGDSISAGIGEANSPWPEILGRQHSLEVVNLARAGATVDSAFEQANEVKNGQSVVLVEIGGNDLLSGFPAAEFGAGLDRLLANLSGQHHSIVMFELPLFPFKNEFGSIQRSLARKYNCLLIPKRCMAQILGTSGATSDGLHLTAAGHVAMAEMVFPLLRRIPKD